MQVYQGIWQKLLRFGEARHVVNVGMRLQQVLYTMRCPVDRCFRRA